MDKICITAMALLILFSVSILAWMTWSGGPPSLWQFMTFNCPAIFLPGLTFGNFNAIALERLGHVTGLAAAVTASIQTLVSVTVACVTGLNST